MSCTKELFVSRAEARHALRGVQGGQFRIYRCSQCGFFHWTSQRSEDGRRVRKLLRKRGET